MEQYERPQVEELGSLEDLTLTTFKDFTGSDGFELVGARAGLVVRRSTAGLD
jgi:hypothetical protein